MMTEAEERQTQYLFKLKQSSKVKRLIQQAFSRQDWVSAGQGWKGVEAELLLTGWSRQRRVIVLRRRIPDEPLLEENKRLADTTPDQPAHGGDARRRGRAPWWPQYLCASHRRGGAYLSGGDQNETDRHFLRSCRRGRRPGARRADHHGKRRPQPGTGGRAAPGVHLSSETALAPPPRQRQGGARRDS